MSGKEAQNPLNVLSQSVKMYLHISQIN